MWKSRDSYLHELKGFVEFHLLKGPEAEDHTLYSSHTVWASKADFEAWTKSEAVPPRACARRQRRQRGAALSRPSEVRRLRGEADARSPRQGRLMQVAAAKPDLAGVLADDPGVVIETAAKEHGVTPREVVEALPAEMRRFAPASAFIDAMKDIADLGRGHADRPHRRRHHGVHRADSGAARSDAAIST